MTPGQIGFVLSQAIRDGYAVTLTRGGQVFVAEPYVLRQQEGAWVIVYWNADRQRVETHRVDLFTDAVDLGRPLNVLPGYAEDDNTIRYSGNYLYSTRQVADMLGISPARVRVLAEARGIGRKLGAGEKANWVFHESEIDALRERKSGRPRHDG